MRVLASLAGAQYPQQRPTLSRSSGMPSGHAQFATFFGSTLLWRAKPGVAGTLFVCAWAGLLLLSRTRHGGQYISVLSGSSVNANQVVGCHTEVQVVAGALMGLLAASVAYPMLFP